MDFWTTIKRVMRYGVAGFVRNGFVSLAAVLIMTITLFVVSGIVISRAALNSTLKQVSEKVDVTVYFLPGATEDQVADVRRSLDALPEVADITYESPEEALAQFRVRHKDDQTQLQALDLLGENPFGPALEIQAKDTAQYEAIAEYVRGLQEARQGGGVAIDRVNFFKNKTAIDRLTDIIETSRALGIAVALILAGASILIAFNTIRLAIYTSRDEIGVMNLVGASHWYVRGPFMIAGLLYGAISGIVVLILLYPILAWIGPGSERFFGEFNVFTYYISHFLYLSGIIMLSGIALGALSSYLAVRRYLHT